MHLFSFTGPLIESLSMVLIATFLMILSGAPGAPCYYKVFDISKLIFFFTILLSHFTLSNYITNFIKSGPIRMIPDEKYGGHLIVLLCNMATIFCKVEFVAYMNFIMNDSIYAKQLIQRSLVTENDILNTAARYVIILLICVLPSAMVVSSLFNNN